MKSLVDESGRGSVLMVTLLFMAILSFTAAHVLKIVLSRHTTTVQTAAWHEARLAAEAGMDLALAELNRNVPDPTVSGSGRWVGWFVSGSSATFATNGTSALVTSPMTISQVPIRIDNLAIRKDSAGLTDTQVDVQVWAVYGVTPNPCFKIRSMGASRTGTPSRIPVDKMDTALRRINLVTSGSARLDSNDNWGTPIPFEPPYAVRIVEALLTPVLSSGTMAARAITTRKTQVLAHSNNWLVNSYDSRKGGYGNTAYAGNGTTGVSNSASHGDIASTMSSGTAITNYRTVAGNVSTSGGTIDNSGTISGQVTSDYKDTLTAQSRPTLTDGQYSGLTGGTCVALAGSTSPSSPTYFRFNNPTGNPGTLKFAAPSTSGSYYVTVVMDASLWNASVVIPSNVFVTVYLQGNLGGSGGGNINTNNSPAHLLIYGETPPAGQTRTVNFSGNLAISAVFFGPDYDFGVHGTVDWYGAITANTYSVDGGGIGGMHFDESLLSTMVQGAVAGYACASYVEDNRQ